MPNRSGPSCCIRRWQHLSDIHRSGSRATAVDIIGEGSPEAADDATRDDATEERRDDHSGSGANDSHR